jgi:hypothetical protein
MAFKPENKLEEALVAAVKNPATAPDFYRLLLDSDLIVPGTAEGHESASGPFQLTPATTLNLNPGFTNGERFLPVFTSMLRMQDYVTKESKYLSLNGRALMDITRGAKLILNPASDYGKVFTPAEIAQLLDPPVPAGAPKTIIGEADFNPRLLEALVTLFQATPEITTAWMIQVTFADRAKEPHPLLGIESAPLDWMALLKAVEAAATKAVPGIVFDVQRVDRARPAGMADALLQSQPIYQRSAAGSFLN